MTWVRERRCRTDHGSVIVLMALGITAIFLIVEIVIDLSATRSDRRNGQLAVDNAASSAGYAFADTDAVDACNTAIDYLEVTLDTTFSGYDCSGFAVCPGALPIEASAPGYLLTLTHPVDDTSPLMAKPSTIGASSTPFSLDLPGTPCQRIGVELTTTGDSYFGGIAGQDSRTSTVHSVVLVAPPADGDRLINLAVLERHDCDAILLAGNGGVVAGPISTRLPIPRFQEIFPLTRMGSALAVAPR